MIAKVKDIVKTIAMLPLVLLVMLEVWAWQKKYGDDWESWQEDEPDGAV